MEEQAKDTEDEVKEYEEEGGGEGEKRSIRRKGAEVYDSREK